MVRFTDMFTELVRTEIDLWNGLDARITATAGLTLPQFQALAAIRSTGETARVQDISEAMSITVGATSKVVDRLERDGLAARTAHPSDRRSSLVGLSERGSQALTAAEIAVEDYLRETLGSTLTDARVVGLTGELSSMRVGVQALGAK